MYYRVDLENYQGKFRGCFFFDTIYQADCFLKWHKYLEDFCINALPNNNHYGTIWELKGIRK